MGNYKTYFKKITGKESFTYQNELAEIFGRRKSLILQAPTGSGKTLALIMPFVYHFFQDNNLPKKLVYSLPLRTLAYSLQKKLVDEYPGIFRNPTNEELDKGYRLSHDNKLILTIQTGEQPDDKYFILGDIVFTTIDQSISSLLCMPLSLSTRQANINAGTILSSFLVFDEFHLLDPDKSMSTLITLLENFKDEIQFCLMSATLSIELIGGYKNLLNCEELKILPEQSKNIENQKDKERKIYINKNEDLTESQIIKLIKENNAKKIIIVCNKVNTCQQLYIKLINKIKKDSFFNEFTTLCIHSRYFKKDRRKIENNILNLFDNNTKMIIIATQVVEVGLDISADLMITQISPINSFIQRIGRAARRKGEKCKIFVFDINVDGKNKYLPYDSEISKATLKELKKYNNKNFTYEDELILVNKILKEKELAVIERIKNSNRIDDIRKVWTTNDKGQYSNLIRDIQNINIIILDDKHINVNPYVYQTISIYRWSFFANLKKINKDEEDWIIGKIEEDTFFDFDDDLDFNKFKININKWINLSADEFQKEQEIKYINEIVVNNKYVNYSKEIGLNFNGKGNEISSIKEKQFRQNFEYKKETFNEHISSMVKFYNSYFKKIFSYFLNELLKENSIKLNPKELIKLIFLFHDLGKLDKRWQEFAHAFQKLKDNYDSNEYFAHTDFNEEKDKSIIEKLNNKRPPHSGAGAINISNYFMKKYKNDTISRIFLNVVLHHHSPQTKMINNFQLIDDIQQILAKYGLEGNGWFVKDCKRSQSVEKRGIKFYNINETFFYFILSSILRNCDRGGIIENKSK